MVTYIIAAAMAVAAWSGSCYWFYTLGVDHEQAVHLRAEAAGAAAQEKVTEVVADALSKMEVKHVTIRQHANTVIREVPVYRDCRNDPRVLRDINAARGAASGAGDGQLPVAASGPAR